MMLGGTRTRGITRMLDRVLREIEFSRMLRMVASLVRKVSVGGTVSQTPSRTEVTSTKRRSPIDPIMVSLNGSGFNLAVIKLPIPQVEFCLL